MEHSELLHGWFPYRLIVDKGELRFKWFYAGEMRFTESFFEESVGACLSLPENGSGKFPLTSAETLMRLADQCETVQPSGIIYHISRCGSTLVSQMLACDPQNIVLSEVPLLDEVLRLKFRNDVTPDVDRDQLFTAVVRLLGRKRYREECRLFIKTDSWHILFYEEIKKRLGDIPEFLMFRSPVEVVASHSRSPAMHTVPGLIQAELFGLDPALVVEMNKDQYLTHVLQCYLGKYIYVLRNSSEAVALNYKQGSREIMQSLFLRCNYWPSESVQQNMKSRTTFHSKKAYETFSGDPVPAGTTADMNSLEKLYDQLCAMTQDTLMNHGS